MDDQQAALWGSVLEEYRDKVCCSVCAVQCVLQRCCTVAVCVAVWIAALWGTLLEQYRDKMCSSACCICVAVLHWCCTVGSVLQCEIQRDGGQCSKVQRQSVLRCVLQWCCTVAACVAVWVVAQLGSVLC